MSAVVVAAALDVVVGEPPLAWHPVAWMGRYLERIGRHVPAEPAARAVAAGGVAWAVGAVGCAGVGVLVDRLGRRLPRPARDAVAGVVLWTLVSGRLLHDEVAAVEVALDDGLHPGRERLARIVSRDTADLDAVEVRASALESLAENLSDSVIAPVFWYVVGGLPAAAAYRFTNTADAMWGYRTPRWEHAGKVAARADDVLNLVPARATALLLASSRDGRLVTRWSRLATEARRTSSPNGGWPMGALALALDLRLAKPGHYVLNHEGRSPGPADTRAALRLAVRAAAVAVAVAACMDRASHYRERGTS